MKIWQRDKRLRSGARNFEYKKRAKKLLKPAGIIALLFITVGFLPSTSMVIPVKSRMTCRKVSKTEQVQNRGICYWDAQSFWHYPWGESIVHKGIDIFAHEGDTVLAATYGVVIDKGYGAVSGNYVKILGPNWRVQYYAHMKKSNVRLFQFVRKVKKSEKLATRAMLWESRIICAFPSRQYSPISGILMTRFKDGKSRFI